MVSVVLLILQLASLLFLVRAVLSWFPVRPSSGFYPVVSAVHRVTEPVLEPIRNRMPRTGGIDLSIFVVLLIINFVLVPIVYQF